MSNGLHSILCQDIFLNVLSSEVHPLLANFLAAPVSLFRALNDLSERTTGKRFQLSLNLIGKSTGQDKDVGAVLQTDLPEILVPFVGQFNSLPAFELCTW